MKKEQVEAMHTGLMKAFHQIRRVNISVMLEISQSEFFALQIISKCQRENPQREGIYVSELAEKLRIAPSQTSRMLRSLEERELIRRSVDTKDRRNTYVFLTEEGKEVCQRTKDHWLAYMKCVLESIGEERVQELIQLCNQMANVMESELQRQMKELPEKQ